MAFVEDFTVFFEDFGVVATLQNASTITVIFDRAQIQAMGGDISGTSPIALAVSADVASLSSGSSTLVIDGTTYTVVDQQADGTGMTTLILQVA